MKFEPALRRPKLTQTKTTPPGFGEKSELSEVGPQTSSPMTIKLPPNPTSRPELVADSAFLKGHSPISYENLPKPESSSGGQLVLYILAGIAVVLVFLGACYYFFFLIPAH
jgi:hypothetical protein